MFVKPDRPCSRSRMRTPPAKGMDGWKSSCWLGAVTDLDETPVDSHLGTRLPQQQEQGVKHSEPQWGLGFSICLPQQLFPIFILVLGRWEDRKVNLGLFLSAGATVDLYKTIWNTAELSLLFIFPKCNLLLISSVSKIFRINVDKVPSWTVINHYEHTTVSVTQLGLSVKLPLNLTVQWGAFFLYQLLLTLSLVQQ